jgi:hypothetical protein
MVAASFGIDSISTSSCCPVRCPANNYRPARDQLERNEPWADGYAPSSPSPDPASLGLAPAMQSVGELELE